MPRKSREAYTPKEGDTIAFTYNDKPRVMLVERVIDTYKDPYINGPELTDNGQIKSFTLSKVQGTIRLANARELAAIVANNAAIAAYLER